jgi:hypothetical protein
MKELVFPFMHFNDIALHGITYYNSINAEVDLVAGKKYWPRLQSSWLRHPSENQNRLKKVVHLVRATLAFSKVSGLASASGATSNREPPKFVRVKAIRVEPVRVEPPVRADCVEPPVRAEPVRADYGALECYSGC